MKNLTNAYQTKGRLSYTAAFISLKYNALYSESAYRRAVIPELKKYYDQLHSQRSHALLHCFSNLLENRFLRNILKNINETILPGDLNHIALRKWFMADQITQLYDHYGGLNVVLLGSGLDPLAHYLTEHLSNVIAFELDSEPVLEIKRSAEFNFDRVHAYHSLSDLFGGLNKDQSRNYHTVFVTEGFWDYSTAEQVESIVRAMGKICTPSASVLTTFFNFPVMDEYDAQTIKKSTASVGENITNTLSLDQFSSLLATQGFEKQIHRDPESLKKQLIKWGLNSNLIDEFHLLHYKR